MNTQETATQETQEDTTFDKMWSDSQRSQGQFLTGDWITTQQLLGRVVQITDFQIGDAYDYGKKQFTTEKQQVVFQLQLVEEQEHWGDEAPAYRASFTSRGMMNLAKALTMQIETANADETGTAPYPLPLPPCVLIHDTTRGGRAIYNRFGHWPLCWASPTAANLQREEEFAAAEAERLAEQAKTQAAEVAKRTSAQTRPTSTQAHPSRVATGYGAR